MPEVLRINAGCRVNGEAVAHFNVFLLCKKTSRALWLGTNKKVRGTTRIQMHETSALFSLTRKTSSPTALSAKLLPSHFPFSLQGLSPAALSLQSGYPVLLLFQAFNFSKYMQVFPLCQSQKAFFSCLVSGSTSLFLCSLKISFSSENT